MNIKGNSDLQNFPEDSYTLLNLIPSPIAVIDAGKNVIVSNTAFKLKFKDLNVLELIEKIENESSIVSFKQLGDNYLARIKWVQFLDNNKFKLLFIEPDFGKLEDKIKTISHDLSNIFTSITNSIEILNHSTKKYPEISKTVKSLENSSARAIDLFEEILSRDSKTKPKLKKINIELLLDEVATTISDITKGNIEVTTNIDSDLPKIEGRYSEVFRILLNLCVNAKDAIKHSNGKIEITCKQLENGKIEIRVSDNGSGISKENINKIFNKGFSTKDGKKISGLGLSIVKQIVEEHRGEISVKSKLNIGTTFTIIFPAIVTVEHIDKKTVKNKIIIAEDEEIIREELSELLEFEGYEVVQAADGMEAFDSVTNTNADLLIIDKKMPKLDGLNCISKIREAGSEIPIILATGSIPDSENRFIQQMNINKIIKKPYSIDELLNQIKNLLKSN